MPKFTVLYFAPCRPDEGVGGGGRLKNMLDSLARLGAGTRLISYWPGQTFGVNHRRFNDNLSATVVSVRKSAPGILKLPALGKVFAYGLRNIRSNGIVLAHAPSIVSGFPAVIVAKMFRKPVVIDLTDVKDPQTPQFLYNMLLRRSNAVFTVSRHLEETARGLGCRNVVCIPVIIDTDVFKPVAAVRAEMRRQLGIRDNETVIGYAGSFWHIEGLAILLRVFKKLSPRYGNLKLVLVGGRNVPGSDDIPGLARELGIEERVALVPPQPHDLMPKYLSVLDIACSPKIDCPENRAASPIKIHEYMSMGLPTVASAIGETVNIIKNGEDGFLVKPGDEDELEKALERLILNPAEAKSVGRKAREKIVRDYGPQATLDRISRTLRALGNRRD